MTMPNAALLFGTLIIGFAIGVLTAGHIVSSRQSVGRRIERGPDARTAQAEESPGKTNRLPVVEAIIRNILAKRSGLTEAPSPDK